MAYKKSMNAGGSAKDSAKGAKGGISAKGADKKGKGKIDKSNGFTYMPNQGVKKLKDSGRSFD